jgi:predicted LPLAT superfamily acyltransferase
MHKLLGWKDSLINFPAMYLNVLCIMAEKKLSQEYLKHRKKHSKISQWYETDDHLICLSWAPDS